MSSRNRLALTSLLAPFLLVAPVLLTGSAFFYGTTVLQFHPWRFFALEVMKAGELPLWNPLSGMGAPLLANYQSALLYPPVWVLFLLGFLGGGTWMAWGQGLLVYLHLALAGWGMVRLVRELGLGELAGTVGGLAFGLSGYLVARSHFLSMNAALAWLPWVLVGVTRFVVVERGKRGRALLAAVSPLAMLLLAGHAQMAWYTLLMAGVWLLFLIFSPNTVAHSHNSIPAMFPGPDGGEDPAGPDGGEDPAGPDGGEDPTGPDGGEDPTGPDGGEDPTGPDGGEDRAGTDSGKGQGGGRFAPVLLFLAALALAALIAAAQLLPTAELLLQSQRAGGADEAFVMTYSFWPWRILGLVAPGLFGSPVTGDYWGYANFWEDAVYIGLLPFLLALRGIGAGRSSGSRRPLVALLVGLTLVSFLLALGDNTPVFPFLFRHIPTFDLFQAPTRWSVWAVFSLSCLAAIGAHDWAARVSSFSRRSAVRWSAVALAVALAGASTWAFLPQIPASFGRATLIAGLNGFAAAVLSMQPGRGERWQIAVAGLVAADLLVAGWGLNPGITLDLYRDRSDDVRQIQSRLAGGRLYQPAGDIYDLTFEQFFPFDDFRVDRTKLRASMLPNLNLLDNLPAASQFDPLMPSRYAAWVEVLESADPMEQDRLLAAMSVTLIERYDPLSANPTRLEDRAARPRVEWFPCAASAESYQEAVAMVAAGEKGLVLESPGAAESGPCSNDASGIARLVQGGSNRLRIETFTPEDGWLLVRDTYYPGWTASVDGDRVDIRPAEGLFRAVPVPAGRHEVDMSYTPASFYAGAAFSLIGLVLFFFLSRRERLRA